MSSVARTRRALRFAGLLDDQNRPADVLAPGVTLIDALDVTAAINLSTRASVLGSTWAAKTGYSGALVGTGAGVKLLATGGALYVSSTLPQTADVVVRGIVKAVVLPTAGDARAGVVARSAAGATDTHLEANVTYDLSDNKWYVDLREVVAGVVTTLGSVEITAPSVGASLILDLRTRGATAAVLLDGVQKISATTAVTATGAIGLRAAVVHATDLGTLAVTNVTGHDLLGGVQPLDVSPVQVSGLAAFVATEMGGALQSVLVTATQDYDTNTTLANITGAALVLAAGTYEIEGWVGFVSADASVGLNLALTVSAGSPTIVAEVGVPAAAAATTLGRITASGGAVSAATAPTTAAIAQFKGHLTITATATLQIQAARTTDTGDHTVTVNPTRLVARKLA
jgi:hypothetical protein